MKSYILYSQEITPKWSDVDKLTHSMFPPRDTYAYSCHRYLDLMVMKQI